MPGKFMRLALLTLAFIASQNACRTKEKSAASDDGDQIFIMSKELVIGHGQHAQMENPPCIRRGMEDVTTIAKNFAAQPKAQTFAIVGKDTPATSLTLEGPHVTGGRSVITETVEDTLRDIGRENAKALAGDGYSSCGTVVFLLPKSSGQVRAVLTAADGQASQQPCTAVEGQYTKCDVGSAAWTWFHEDRYFVATFKNWSDNLGRTAKIDLYP